MKNVYGTAAAPADPRDGIIRDVDPVVLYRCAYRIRLSLSDPTPGIERTIRYLEARAGERTLENARRRRRQRLLRRYLRFLAPVLGMDARQLFVIARSIAPDAAKFAVLVTCICVAVWTMIAGLSGGPVQ